jgi:hypothetical protein
MLHFSCDLCGKDLTAGTDNRYVLKLEIYAALDPREITEDDLDDDHLEAISQKLADEPDLEPVSTFVKQRYDLCDGCRRRFAADPLGREAQKFDFSPN